MTLDHFNNENNKKLWNGVYLILVDTLNLRHPGLIKLFSFKTDVFGDFSSYAFSSHIYEAHHTCKIVKNNWNGTKKQTKTKKKENSLKNQGVAQYIFSILVVWSIMNWFQSDRWSVRTI